MQSSLNPFLLFFLLLVKFHPLIGQENTIKGKIIDEEGHPVKFATVSCKGKNIGTYTDTVGVFTLKAIDFDSLFISHIGFKSQTIAVNNINLEGFKEIVLESRIQEIKEIVISGRENDKRIGKHVSYENGNRSTNKGNPMYYGSMNAVYFKNVKTPGRIEKISFFINISCPTNNQLRIRFLTADPLTKRPGHDFVNEEILISDIKQNSWLRINLKDYKIVIPSNDFFVVLESLSKRNDCFNNRAGRDSLGSYNLVIACVESKAIGYRKFFDGEWKNHTEEIGDKEKARKNATERFQQMKEGVELARKNNKKHIENINASIDHQLQFILDGIDEKWNFVPYIQMETKTDITK